MILKMRQVPGFSGAVDLLSSLSFVKSGQNVLIVGASGTGKTYLAKSLAIHACRSFRGQYWHSSQLIDGLVDLKKTNFRNTPGE